MTAKIFQLPYQTVFTGTGVPIAGSKVFFYQAGTLTPQNAYTESDLATAHANPVVADAAGRLPPIYLDGSLSYRVIVRDSTDSLIFDEDDYTDQLTADGIGQILYVRTPSEISAGVTPVNYQYPFANVMRYGATGDGVTDDSSAFNALSSVLEVDGGESVIPPSTYLLSSQWLIDAGATDRIVINAFGAIIKTTGAISGLAIRGGVTQGGTVVKGLKIDHANNTDATCGFDVYGAWFTVLEDCYVGADDVNASYAAFRIRQEDPADNATGAFWTRLERCGIRQFASGSGTNIPYGVLLQGEVNDTSILNCKFTRAATCIYQTTESGQTGISNAVLVQGTAFESYTTAYKWEGNSSIVRGPSFIGNRFEAGTTVYEFAGTKSSTAVPPFMVGNVYISGSGTYLVDSASVRPTVLDFSITPSIDPTMEFLGEPLQIRNIQASTNVLKLIAQNTGYGLAVATSDETVRASLVTKAGGGGSLVFDGNLGDIKGLRGVSGTGTQSNNLRGTVTLSSGTASVSFGTAETDATYFVATGCSAAESISVTSKATTGFTLTSSNGSSTATVDWLLVR